MRAARGRPPAARCRPRRAARLLLPVRETDAHVAAGGVRGAGVGEGGRRRRGARRRARLAGRRRPRGGGRARSATLKAAGAVAPLRAAWQAAHADADYGARVAILGALAAIDRAAATPALTEALGDNDWAVRRPRGGAACRSSIRAADRRRDPAGADGARCGGSTRIAAVVSPRVLDRTSTSRPSKGTIEIELAVLDAPLTVHNFVTLARKGYFDGLAFHRVVAELRRAGRRSARRRRRRPGLHDPRRAQRAAVPARHGRDGARLAATPAAASSSSRTPRSRTSTRGTRCSATSSTGWTWSDRLAAGGSRAAGAGVGRDAVSRRAYTKMGARAPPTVERSEQQLPLLAAFFFAPLAAFFAMFRIPPFLVLDVRGAIRASARLCRLARRPAAVGRPRVGANSRAGRETSNRNKRGCVRTPPERPTASSRPSSSRPSSRSSSPFFLLERWLLSLPTVTVL